MLQNILGVYVVTIAM